MPRLLKAVEKIFVTGFAGISPNVLRRRRLLVRFRLCGLTAGGRTEGRDRKKQGCDLKSRQMTP
jgi:hypothetical protein